MTRIRGSVPEARTRTLPSSPSSSSTRRTSSQTSSASPRSALRSHPDVLQDLGVLGDRLGAELAQLIPGGGDHLEEPHAGEQAVAGVPLVEKMICPDCSPPSTALRSAIASIT